PATAAGSSAYATATGLTVSHTAYNNDAAGSGVASSLLTVASAPLSNGICGGYGSAVAANDGVFSATDGNCYRFTLTGIDAVGNAVSISVTMKVDTTAPSQPSI